MRLADILTESARLLSAAARSLESLSAFLDVATTYVERRVPPSQKHEDAHLAEVAKASSELSNEYGELVKKLEADTILDDENTGIAAPESA